MLKMVVHEQSRTKWSSNKAAGGGKKKKKKKKKRRRQTPEAPDSHPADPELPTQLFPKRGTLRMLNQAEKKKNRAENEARENGRVSAAPGLGG